MQDIFSMICFSRQKQWPTQKTDSHRQYMHCIRHAWLQGSYLNYSWVHSWIVIPSWLYNNCGALLTWKISGQLDRTQLQNGKAILKLSQIYTFVICNLQQRAAYKFSSILMVLKLFHLYIRNKLFNVWILILTLKLNYFVNVCICNTNVITLTSLMLRRRVWRRPRLWKTRVQYRSSSCSWLSMTWASAGSLLWISSSPCWSSAFSRPALSATVSWKPW